MPVMADGFISTVAVLAAVLAAVRTAPEAVRTLFAARRSAEQGHEAALDALGVQPILPLDMRLGEGAGAALALPVLRAAATVLREMATFARASVSEKSA